MNNYQKTKTKQTKGYTQYVKNYEKSLETIKSNDVGWKEFLQEKKKNEMKNHDLEDYVNNQQKRERERERERERTKRERGFYSFLFLFFFRNFF